MMHGSVDAVEEAVLSSQVQIPVGTGLVGSTGAGVAASFQKHFPASLRHSVATSPAHTLTDPAAEVDPVTCSQVPPWIGLVGSAGVVTGVLVHSHCGKLVQDDFSGIVMHIAVVAAGAVVPVAGWHLPSWVTGFVGSTVPGFVGSTGLTPVPLYHWHPLTQLASVSSLAQVSKLTVSRVILDGAQKSVAGMSSLASVQAQVAGGQVSLANTYKQA